MSATLRATLDSSLFFDNSKVIRRRAAALRGWLRGAAAERARAKLARRNGRKLGSFCARDSQFGKEIPERRTHRGAQY